MIRITRILNLLNHLDNLQRGVYKKQEREIAKLLVEKYMKSYEFNTQICELQQIIHKSKNTHIHIKKDSD